MVTVCCVLYLGSVWCALIGSLGFDHPFPQPRNPGKLKALVEELRGIRALVPWIVEESRDIFLSIR